MTTVLDAIVYTAGAVTLLMLIGALFRGAGRLFYDMVETLFGVITGEYMYDPEAAQVPPPSERRQQHGMADDTEWSATDLVKLAQGLQLLRLMDLARNDFAKSDLSAGAETIEASEELDAGSESDGAAPPPSSD